MVKFVYTLSDKGRMVQEAIKSIKSLLRFVEKGDIIVYYTPPRSKENLKKLSQFAVVREVPNLTKPFVFSKEIGPSRYGEKVHLCDTNCPIVIFLDTDTIVKKNPLDLLDGDFDFFARPGTVNYDLNNKIWEDMFRMFNAKPILIPNTGFMIFKNWCHKDIRDLWLNLINSPLPNPHPINYLKEQYALAIALSVKKKKIKWMGREHHIFRWIGEKNDTYVLHEGRVKLRRKLIPFKIRRWILKVLKG